MLLCMVMHLKNLRHFENNAKLNNVESSQLGLLNTATLNTEKSYWMNPRANDLIV